MKENISQNNKENSNIEKRNFLYKKIEEKVGTILELRNFAKEHENDSLQDLEVSLRKKQDELFDNYLENGFVDNEGIKKLNEYPLIFKEAERLIEDLNKREQEIRDSSRDDSDFSQKLNSDLLYTELNNKIEKLNEQCVTESPNGDFDFLKKVGFFANGLLQKKSGVLEYENIYKESLEEFNALVKKKIDLDLETLNKDDYKISFRGYSVLIELSESAFNKWRGRPDNNGVHVSGEPFIIIKDIVGKEKTLNHEENHNISESFIPGVEYHENLSNRLNYALALLEAYEKVGIDKDADKIKLAREVAKDGLKKSISEYTFENFSEIIADIDRLSERKINTYLWNFIDAAGDLDEMKKNVKDEEIKQTLDEALKISKLQFTDYINKLSNIFFISEKFGDIDQAKGAIILFKHEHINKAENYLKHHFGEEKYNIYKSLQPLVCGGTYFSDIEEVQKMLFDLKMMKMQAKGDYNIVEDLKLDTVDELLGSIKQTNGLSAFLEVNNLRNLALSLNENKIKLTNEDKTNIQKTLANYTNWLEPVILNKINVDNLREIDVYLKEIGRDLSISGLDDLAEKKIAPAFFTTEIFMSLSKKNWDVLLDAYDRWPLEQCQFQFVLGDALLNMNEMARSMIINDQAFIDFTEKANVDPGLLEIFRRGSESEEE